MTPRRILLILFMFLGCFQGIAYLRHSTPAAMLARSSGASPLALAFYNSGQEFWALEHTVEGQTKSGQSFHHQLEPGFVNRTGYPYFIKMIYSYPFGFAHELPDGLWRGSLNYICQDPKILEILQLDSPLANLKITIVSKNANLNLPPKEIKHQCP